jgi:hypothetical protein
MVLLGLGGLRLISALNLSWETRPADALPMSGLWAVSYMNFLQTLYCSQAAKVHV